MDYHRIPYFLFFNCNFIKSKLHIPYSHHFLCVEHYREPILKKIQKNHRKKKKKRKPLGNRNHCTVQGNKKKRIETQYVTKNSFLPEIETFLPNFSGDFVPGKNAEKKKNFRKKSVLDRISINAFHNRRSVPNKCRVQGRRQRKYEPCATDFL